MLVVRGPHKVDFLTDVRNEQQPRWTVKPETLSGIDAHFWDWMLWLASKHLRGREQLVREELEKLHDYLLAPMGAREQPCDINSAVAVYNRVRRRRERQLGVTLPNTLRTEVERALVGAGIR